MEEVNEKLLPQTIAKSEEKTEKESIWRKCTVPASQIVIMIRLYDKMKMPFSLFMEMARYHEGMYQVSILHDEKDALLVQWFMEETLRREADKSYRGSDYYD